MMKHEQATLVVLAYTIGFTTAFIAFGITTTVPATQYQVESIVDSTQQATAITATLEERHDGLFMVLGDTERVIAAKAYDELENKEGFYNAIVSATVSPSGQYAYFCSQLSSDDNFCLNYIYDADTDTVHRVQTREGMHVASLNSDTALGWDKSGKLVVGTRTSVTAGEPWVVE
ncbi:hypothetical protein H6783_03080 [Candidatus Nomurabacteria bacterium]|nr:hypothetical protein [Candidatus Nomurabacteria bacterium]